MRAWFLLNRLMIRASREAKVRVPWRAARFIVATTVLLSLISPMPRSEGQGGDEAFLEVWEAVPEFGGAWVHDNSAHIWITDDSKDALHRARLALIDELGSEFETDRTVEHPAKYTFKELYDWHIAARDVLTVEGAISTDIDERRNRLAIATEDPEHERAMIKANWRRLAFLSKQSKSCGADRFGRQVGPRPGLHDGSSYL